MATASKPSPISTIDQVAKPKLSMYLQVTRELWKVFDVFDANGDDQISICEFDLMLKTLGSFVPCEELPCMMEDVDTYKGRFINLEEFTAFYEEPMAFDDAGEFKLCHAFDLYNQYQNSLISNAELLLVLALE